MHRECVEHSKCYARHCHTEFLRFLREIDRFTPNEIDIHLIVDYYSTHKHGHAKRWFDRHLRFHAYFIPRPRHGSTL